MGLCGRRGYIHFFWVTTFGKCFRKPFGKFSPPSVLRRVSSCFVNLGTACGRRSISPFLACASKTPWKLSRLLDKSCRCSVRTQVQLMKASGAPTDLLLKQCERRGWLVAVAQGMAQREANLCRIFGMKNEFLQVWWIWQLSSPSWSWRRRFGYTTCSLRWRGPVQCWRNWDVPAVCLRLEILVNAWSDACNGFEEYSEGISNRHGWLARKSRRSMWMAAGRWGSSNTAAVNMPLGYSLSFNVLETKLFTLLLGERYLAHGDIFCSLLGSQLNREHEVVVWDLRVILGNAYRWSAVELATVRCFHMFPRRKQSCGQTIPGPGLAR